MEERGLFPLLLGAALSFHTAAWGKELQWVASESWGTTQARWWGRQVQTPFSDCQSWSRQNKATGRLATHE